MRPAGIPVSLLLLVSAAAASMAPAALPVACRAAAPAGAQQSATAADSAAGRPILRVEPGGHVGAVHQVLFADEFGKRVVTAGQDKAVRVWDAETGRQVRVLLGQAGEGREGHIYAAAVSGGTLATAGNDVAEVDSSSAEYRTKKRVLAVRLFDLASGRVRKLLPGHEQTIVGLAFSPDGALLVSTAYDDTVRAWDPESGKQVRTLAAAGATVLAVAFSPDGATVAGAGQDGAVRLWDAATGKLRGTLPAGKSAARAVAFAKDGALACGSEDGRVRVWQAPKPGAGPDATLDHAAGAAAVTSVAFSPDGQTLLSGSGETENAAAANARAWSAADGKPLATFRGHSDTVVNVSVSPDGSLAASADASGEVFLWDPATGREERRLAGTGERPFSVAWSADGKKLAWGTGRDGRFTRAFDLFRNRPETPGAGGDAGWVRASLEQNGKTLSAAPDRSAVVVSQNGREAARIKDKDWQPGERVRCFAWAPQNRVVVATTFGLALYDGASGKRLASFPGHAGIVEAVSVSGRYLASASADQTVRVWNLDERGGSTGGALSGRRDAVDPLLSLFFGSDGEWVAWNERSGFYAASAAGDDLIGWQVNRGAARAAEFFRAFQFRGRFYQPDVVCRLLEAGSVAGAAKAAAALPALPGGTLRSPVPDAQGVAAQIARTPGVEVVSVEGAESDGKGAYRTTAQKVSLRVKVTNVSDPADTEVRLRINRPVFSRRLREVPESGAGVRTLDALLRPGDNALTVVACGPGGAESTPVVVRVRCDPPGGPATAAEPNLHVLSVGVSRYADPAIEGNSPLYFANRDASRIAEFYQKQTGKLAKNITVRTLSDGEATRAKIEAELATLEKSVGPNDRVIVFLSGHGFYIDDAFFFAPHDAKLKDLANTAVGAEKMLARLSGLKCADVVLMLDHCYSGGVNLKLVDAQQARGRDFRNEQGRRLREANLFTLTASMPDQESYEHQTWQNGAFTFALLEALNGKARGRDGYADLTGVRDYLLERVPGLVKEVGLPPQIPKLFYPPTIDDLMPARVRIARLPGGR